FREGLVLRGIDGELKAAPRDFELSRKRLTLLSARDQSLLQTDLGESEGSDQGVTAVVIIIVIIAENCVMTSDPDEESGAEHCQTGGPTQDDLSAGHVGLRQILAWD